MFDARIGDISGRGKLAADMREIWLMQPRFERRTPSSALSLVEQVRFRAGFDFLRLRWISISIAALLLVLSVSAIAVKGFNFALDFTGGTVVELRFDQPPDVDHVREQVEALGGPVRSSTSARL